MLYEWTHQWPQLWQKRKNFSQECNSNMMSLEDLWSRAWIGEKIVLPISEIGRSSPRDYKGGSALSPHLFPWKKRPSKQALWHSTWSLPMWPQHHIPKGEANPASCWHAYVSKKMDKFSLYMCLASKNKSLKKMEEEKVVQIFGLCMYPGDKGWSCWLLASARATPGWWGCFG